MVSFKRMKNKVKWKSEPQDYENAYSEKFKKRLYELDKFSLDNSHKEWHKHVFKIELENIYDIKNINDMNRIHDKDVIRIKKLYVQGFDYKNITKINL